MSRPQPRKPLPPGEWRAIPDDVLHLASSSGEIYSLHRQRIMRPAIGKRGYPVVTRRDPSGKTFTTTVGDLVMAAFVGPKPEGMCIRHLNDIKTDNRLENLAYGTPKENAQDVLRNGNNFQANKTWCINGHPLTPENVIIRRNDGGRQCRECDRLGGLEYRRRQRVETGTGIRKLRSLEELAAAMSRASTPSRRALARAAGVHASTVHGLFHGRRFVYAHNAERIETALGVELFELPEPCEWRAAA